jgi:1,4-dihydroxy-2-naphthoate octaprenyltransferase
MLCFRPPYGGLHAYKACLSNYYMLTLALQLIEANIFHIFFFVVFAAQFYHKQQFPLGMLGFGLFAFLIFPAFKAGQVLGITFFHTANTIVFLAFIAVPTIIFLSGTRIGRFVPLIVISELLLLTGANYFI